MGLDAKSLCRRCQSSVDGLSRPGEVVHTDLAEDAETCTAKHSTVTHILLTRFDSESQQSFPTFQQIYHTCQLLKFGGGPCLFGFRFLGKKKLLPTLTHTRIVLALLCKCRWAGRCVDCIFKCTLMFNSHRTRQAGLLFARTPTLRPGFGDVQ